MAARVLSLLAVALVLTVVSQTVLTQAKPPSYVGIDQPVDSLGGGDPNDPWGDLDDCILDSANSSGVEYNF